MPETTGEGENVASLTCHTGLIATQVYFPHSSLFFIFDHIFCRHTGILTTLFFNVTPGPFHALPPHRSISPFFFFAREDENVAYLTCHTSLITTQDYFHTGLSRHRFICHMGPLYALLPNMSIIYSKIPKVKILHALFATQDSLPHRFIACFKVTQVFTKCRDNRRNKSG